jgi:hypothetical protein
MDCRMTATLVRPLFDGPLDIVGDVHGEIDSLDLLLRRLGYDVEGRHPEGRRLVFVGDLVDRGPDSPTAVERARLLVETGRAQCVLGNHELNILLDRRKDDNGWFFHHRPAPARPEVRANEQARTMIRDFFRTLPLALERPDIRVVHACWDDEMIAAARRSASVEQLHGEEKAKVKADIQARGVTDPSATKLLHQNKNAVKLLTSGPEEKAAEPFEAMGKMRHERRVAWWHAYPGPLCVFGHYWRIMLPWEVDNDRLFTDVPLNATLGRGDAMCVDYSVGKRFMERRERGFTGAFHARLAALRLPERVLIFDNAEQLPLIRG